MALPLELNMHSLYSMIMAIATHFMIMVSATASFPAVVGGVKALFSRLARKVKNIRQLTFVKNQSKQQEYLIVSQEKGIWI